FPYTTLFRSIMVEETSKMFITGPKVIETVTGEKISADDLGGSKVHNSKSGNAHINAKDEAEALNKVRAILSYLPGSNAYSTPISSYDLEDEHNCSDLTEI